MADADGERYLREMGERWLLDGALARHGHSPLELPAAALAAAGAIGAETAKAVLDAYATARSARVEAGRRFHRELPIRRPPGSALRPIRVATLDAELEYRGGRLTLRELERHPASATLHYDWNRGAAGLRAAGGGLPWGGRVPAIRDHRGRPVSAHGGSGGGNEDHWEGELRLGRLPAGTPAIQVEKERVPLDWRPTPVTVRVEPLDPEPAPVRLLWRRIMVVEHFFRGLEEVEPGIDALLAVGALDPGDPVIAAVREVAGVMPHHPDHLGRGPGAVPRSLPEPWRALLERFGAEDGPCLRLPVAALTPPFDEVRIAFASLVSEPTAFQVRFEASPNVLHATLTELPVAWWARDELGHHHLGAPTGWEGGRDRVAGVLRFWPALHPRARRLELMPTADTRRAVVAIDLPQAPA